MSSPRRGPTGLFGFTIVWFGQFVSMVGTGMTQFAIIIWAYQLTGQATALALVGFFAFAPVVVFSPLAGAIVDRVPRKVVMIASDLAAGLSTVALLLLHLSGHLQLWHLFATGFLAGAFGSFQFPAYSAAISLMMEKKHYARATAMLGLAGDASGIIAPMLAGGLLVLIGIRGIFMIDIATFVVAIGTLVVVFVPEPERATHGAERASLWSDMLFGFRYIFASRSLLGLQLVFFASNLIATFGFTVFAPMILARTGSDSLVFGSVQMAFGIGGVVGGLVMTAWGGFKRRVHGVLLGMAFSSLFGTVILGASQSLVLWVIGSLCTALFLPLINGSNQAIWQSKVPPALQGRVFATRRLIAQVSAPIAMLAAGPLADRVFEPLMTSGSAFARVLSHIVGSGRGAGMGLMLVIAGILGTAVGLSGYLFPAVRNAETLLPDHDAAPTAEPAESPG
jgi:DHA3 family macrolide efflux protein-like MFS transporter